MKKGLVLYAPSKELLSADVRRGLFARCLNLEFDSLLTDIRKLPLDRLEESFLQLFLVKSVQHAHIPSVDFLWYRFVMGRKVLMVKPQLLCGIGAVALHGSKPFIPRQLCMHFEKFYGDKDGLDQYRQELLRIKVESFAKSAGSSISFREKWKVFLEEIDKNVDETCVLRVRDFPYLAESAANADRDLLAQLLFEENKIAIKNRWTLPLLLNLVLLQPRLDADFKTRIFSTFYETHKSLDYADSICILFQSLQNDIYRSTKLMQFLNEQRIPLPPLAAKIFMHGTTKNS
ncbi:LAQU0S02e09186g1_1 [Lachancea quebecensis]|uniref:LAQU0S02e09186g1_1 n=1 Tax=Lachancea quebecensis TaxID=1654605 RepID=A0A0P1KMJ9_9SACH|nr:LAQU0S02e09186g1_1 [Lachancea quebecensis]